MYRSITGSASVTHYCGDYFRLFNDLKLRHIKRLVVVCFTVFSDSLGLHDGPGASIKPICYADYDALKACYLVLYHIAQFNFFHRII